MNAPFGLLQSKTLRASGIDICHETVRFWVNRFGAKFAKEIRKKRVGHHSNWQWHLDDSVARQGMFACLRGSLSKLTAKGITYGAQSIMKGKFTPCTVN